MAACEVDDLLDTGRRNESSDRVCTPGGGDNICESCIRTSCCSPLRSCRNDAECRDLLYCQAQACRSTSCLDRCEADTPDGVQPLERLVMCAEDECRNACDGLAGSMLQKVSNLVPHPE